LPGPRQVFRPGKCVFSTILKALISLKENRSLAGEQGRRMNATSKSNPISFVTLALVGLLLVISVLIYLHLRSMGESGADLSQQQHLATELEESKLYLQAVEEYERLLDADGLSRKKRANINYIIGNIYINNLRDYENAAARFIRAKALDPESDLKDRINKSLVICFERMGRSLEAQRQLERSTDLDQSKKGEKGGVVVGKIRDREITMRELENEIEKLPPSVQSQFEDKEGRLKFLQSYIGSELLYHAALRKGLDKDKDVNDGAFQFRKQMMINKLLAQEIPQDTEMSESEIKLYYDAHGEEFKDKKLSQVKDQIESELKRMKQEEAYSKLISKMLEAEQVKIFDDRF
jgi:tetratricopeptide (TPR) repeat protein